ncbi:MAG: amino acid permease [Candidatus Limnocylindrales bacterium]|nr:amino acid permease [Candidatus Limnocylindrales bacterium]
MAATGGRALFTRQSSGLVREVSVTNALFFNTSAFIGAGLGWYPVFYSLAYVPIGMYAAFTTYGWASIIVGLFCILLALIFASLTSVMPRSGGDYVFTSRIVPRVGPFLGWLESWTLAFASLAIIAFEVPIVVRNLQITGRIVGIGTGSDFFNGANAWFTDETGAVTGVPGFIASLIVLALIALITFQAVRRFHRIITSLAILGLVGAGLMFVVGMVAITPEGFAANLPQYSGGVTVDQLAAAGDAAGFKTTGIDLTPDVFAFIAGIVLLNYIGFQYSAYISGEIRGNVRRGIIIALLGALGIAVLMNSVYTDFISSRLGLDGQVAWGAIYWGFITDPALPLGQPNSMPLMGVIATPGLWPIWTIVSLAVTLFPFLLCPVYIAFLSRVQLAWSLDRQVPEWFGRVSERLHAPANAILAAIFVAGLLALLQNFPILRAVGLGFLAPVDGKLNLVSTLWFSILAAGLTWIMPGVNALLVRWTRPDLAKDAPFRTWLPVMGLVWVVMTVGLYWYAGVSPILNRVGAGAEESQLDYLNRTGITMTLVIFAAGIVIYLVQAARNRAAGIDTRLMYQEIPPD